MERGLELLEEEASVMRKYIKWMGAYWSGTEDQYEALMRALDQGNCFDLDAIGFRELEQRPKGPITWVHDAERRDDVIR